MSLIEGLPSFSWVKDNPLYMLSKISQAEKGKYSMVSLIYGSKKYSMISLIYGSKNA